MRPFISLVILLVSVIEQPNVLCFCNVVGGAHLKHTSNKFYWACWDESSYLDMVYKGRRNTYFCLEESRVSRGMLLCWCVGLLGGSGVGLAAPRE